MRGALGFMEVPSAAALGAAVGRNTTAVVGIVDAQLAKGIRGYRRSARGFDREPIEEDGLSKLRVH